MKNSRQRNIDRRRQNRFLKTPWSPSH